MVEKNGEHDGEKNKAMKLFYAYISMSCDFSINQLNICHSKQNIVNEMFKYVKAGDETQSLEKVIER